MSHPLIGTVLRGADPAADIRTLAPLGFECFQVFFWQTLGTADLRSMADSVRRAAEETGTRISALGIYGNVLQGDALAEETRHGFESLIAEAGAFGTELVSGFAGRIPDRPIEESVGPWKAVFGDLVRRADDQGVRLALENCRMGGTWKRGSWNIAIGPDAWKMMFEALPSETLGLEWEPCHQLLCLADPVSQLETWAPRIFHVHGKDANVNWDIIRSQGLFGRAEWSVQRTAGFGDSDWTAIIKALVRAGYNGTIDIEGWNDPVYKGERETEGQVLGLRYLKDCRRKAL
jgi:sugar phosphate isomerase/epimerase